MNLIKTIKIDEIEVSQCEVCSKIFSVTRFEPYVHIPYCSDLCLLKAEKNRNFPPLVPQKDLDWWVSALHIKRTPQKLAHWSNLKNIGSKTGQFLAHFSGSTTPLRGVEPMSQRPENHDERMSQESVKGIIRQQKEEFV